MRESECSRRKDERVRRKESERANVGRKEERGRKEIRERVEECYLSSTRPRGQERSMGPKCKVHHMTTIQISQQHFGLTRERKSINHRWNSILTDRVAYFEQGRTCMDAELCMREGTGLPLCKTQSRYSGSEARRAVHCIRIPHRIRSHTPAGDRKCSTI